MDRYNKKQLTQNIQSVHTYQQDFGLLPLISSFHFLRLDCQLQIISQWEGPEMAGGLLVPNSRVKSFPNYHECTQNFQSLNIHKSNLQHNSDRIRNVTILNKKTKSIAKSMAF